eukprot:scaffold96791_cov67-Phaeocystis_antarctica.AAC.4
MSCHDRYDRTAPPRSGLAQPVQITSNAVLRHAPKNINGGEELPTHRARPTVDVHGVQDYRATRSSSASRCGN